jgi:hypothetical protein
MDLQPSEWLSSMLGLRAKPLSCIPPVVMQKTSQGTNWTENPDNTGEAEII